MENKLPEAPYIVFSKDQYTDEKDFWNAVGQQLKLLTDNDYNVLVSYEDCGYYRIEYTPRDLSYGDIRFVALTSEQHEYILDAIYTEEEN